MYNLFILFTLLLFWSVLMKHIFTIEDNSLKRILNTLMLEQNLSLHQQKI